MKPLGLEVGMKGKTVIVQGFGNVGYHAARILESEGEALIIFDDAGLDNTQESEEVITQNTTSLLANAALE